MVSSPRPAWNRSSPRPTEEEIGAGQRVNRVVPAETSDRARERGPPQVVGATGAVYHVPCAGRSRQHQTRRDPADAIPANMCALRMLPTRSLSTLARKRLASSPIPSPSRRPNCRADRGATRSVCGLSVQISPSHATWGERARASRVLSTLGSQSSCAGQSSRNNQLPQGQSRTLRPEAARMSCSGPFDSRLARGSVSTRSRKIVGRTGARQESSLLDHVVTRGRSALDAWRPGLALAVVSVAEQRLDAQASATMAHQI
jgi:hypothetical protein